MEYYLKCDHCGYIHKEEELPQRCPSCGASKDRFSQIDKDYQNIHMFYGEKISYENEVQINPFFGDFQTLAAYIYNIPPGKKAPLHRHSTTDELFFVIKGTLKFKVEDKEWIATKGDLVQAKMNTSHTFENVGEEHAAFLSVKGPKPVDLEVLKEVNP